MTLFGDIPTYLNMYVNIADRRIITLLRTNGLPIRNNLYRIKVENDNVCCKCLSGEKENEIHYLLKCSNYTSILLSMQIMISSHWNRDSSPFCLVIIYPCFLKLFNLLKKQTYWREIDIILCMQFIFCMNLSMNDNVVVFAFFSCNMLTISFIIVDFILLHVPQ